MLRKINKCIKYKKRKGKFKSKSNLKSSKRRKSSKEDYNKLNKTS